MRRASAQRIIEVLDEVPDITNPKNPITRVPDGSIKFDNSLTVEKIDKSSLKRTLFDKKVDIRKILLNGINRNKKTTI